MPDPARLDFTRLAHADWSVRPAGRWRAVADRTDDGWLIGEAAPVGPLQTFLAGLSPPGGALLLGVDLPIGAPAAWARRAGVTDFLRALPRFGVGEWSEFYDRAATSDEIDLRRPFYPAGQGGRGEHKHQYLADALGVAGMDALRRRCDFNARGARSGTPLFWTSGPAQVGRAAGDFWQGVLTPALSEGAARVWPFDGTLGRLAETAPAVIAETYPGEAYRWFDLEIVAGGKSKRRLSDRKNDACRIIAAGERLGGRFTAEARAQIGAGFPVGGDDAFDAMVGLLALIEVVDGHRPEGTPDDPDVKRIEGWILGRAPAPLSVLPSR